ARSHLGAPPAARALPPRPGEASPVVANPRGRPGHRGAANRRRRARDPGSRRVGSGRGGDHSSQTRESDNSIPPRGPYTCRPMARIFLISPASCSGLRARFIMRPGAGSLLAERLRAAAGVPLGEVYTFLSGLYFRGKLAYARAFAQRPEDVLVITPTVGL